MKAAFARIHNGLAWLLTLGSVLQFFLIAVTFFGGGSSEIHANSGRVLEGLAFFLLISALVVRSSRRTTWTSLAVFLLLVPIQGLLAYSDLPPAVNALHAVTGTTILYLSYALAHGWARAEVPSTVRQPVIAD